jgi:hypothetical protein
MKIKAIYLLDKHTHLYEILWSYWDIYYEIIEFILSKYFEYIKSNGTLTGEGFLNRVGFQVVTTVTLKSTIILDVTPCSQVEVH